MSDIQDLIHKTTMDSLQKGAEREQERIIKLLEPLMQEIEASNCDCYIVSRPLIALIKGETE